MMPRTSGIYKITCTPTGKFYIGSATNMGKRQAQHLYALRNNSHHTKALQNAWNKYGEDAFTFEVVEFVLPTLQVEREQYWLDTLKPFGKHGFNVNRTANKPSFLPETCEKIRLAKLGHTVSEASRMKLSTAKRGKPGPNLGKTFSAEVCAKISASKCGVTAWNKGKSPTPEVQSILANASAHRRKTLIVTSPDGTEYVVTGIRKFCENHHLHTGHLMDVALGKQTNHKGWIARLPDN